MMGAGKSTVAAEVARSLGIPAVDTDARVVEDAGRSIAEIFASQGEAAFRALERAAIEEVAGERCVAALGGGAMAEPGTPERLRETGRVFYLAARPETLAARIAAAGGRPLLEGLDPAGRLARLAELLEARAPAYEKADVRIETDGRTPAEVVRAILGALGQAP